MARDKRPTASPNTPSALEEGRRPPPHIRCQFISSSTSIVLRPEFRDKGFFYEHTINPNVLGDHESVLFARAYLDEIKLEAIYTPPDVFFPNLVCLLFQNISFPVMDGVRPFAIASIVGKIKIIFTPDEMVGFLGFPIEPPEDVEEASLSVPHHVFVGPLAGGESGAGGCTLRVAEPPKLWIIDHFLKCNLLQVGYSQQWICYFKQVLYAALQGSGSRTTK